MRMEDRALLSLATHVVLVLSDTSSMLCCTLYMSCISVHFQMQHVADWFVQCLSMIFIWHTIQN